MSDEVERKKVHLTLRASNIQDARFTNRAGIPGYVVMAEFSAETTDYDLWETINKRLVNDGLALYETASIHEEVLASIVSGHEREKALLNDQIRKLQDRATELEQQVSHANYRASIAADANAHLVSENISLRGLKAALDEIAGLGLLTDGKIPS